jgi:general secretion pathway protein K
MMDTTRPDISNSTDRAPRPEILRGRKGVALIMVLTVITILTAITVQFQYEGHVYINSTTNFRDKTKARYLARSAIEFTRLILYLQGTVDTLLKRFWKNNPPKIQLWQLIPIDSDLARAVAGGIFSMQEQQSLFEDTAIGTSMDNPDSAAAKQAESVNAVSFGQSEGFGAFEGHFHAEVKDEESKINVNVRPGDFKEVNMMKAELERLFAPVKYNPLFENPDKYGQYHDRQEIISSIIDWIDPDNTRSGFETGDESSRYDFLPDPYPSRNHMFDSLEELQLVAGIDDRFWRLFKDSLTVYRTNKININTAGPEVIRAILEQYIEPPLPPDAELQRILDVLMDFRVQNGGFWNEDAFINFLTNGPELFLELAGGAKGKAALKSAITVESKVFTIEASGDINGVMTTITVVMTKDGTLLYYKEN